MAVATRGPFAHLRASGFLLGGSFNLKLRFRIDRVSIGFCRKLAWFRSSGPTLPPRGSGIPDSLLVPAN